MNKKTILVMISFLWVMVAVGLIMSKQYIIRTGKTVILETVPIDPRDFLRGDYVILRYKISTLDLNKIKSEKQYYRRGEAVYVKLKPGDRFWEAVAIQVKRDRDGDRVFIKGQAGYCYNGNLAVNYGIESYFVPEGEGKEIEKNMRGNKSSVKVEVLVDSFGNALIKKVYPE